MIATAAPALAAGPSVVALQAGDAPVAVLAATGATAPVILPIFFGQRPLGRIVTVEARTCFDQFGSPIFSCNADGSIALLDALAPPFFLAGPFRRQLATGIATPVEFPVSLHAGEQLEYFMGWAVDRLEAASEDMTTRHTAPGSTRPIDTTVSFTGTGVAPGPCVPSASVLCLGGSERFKVEAHFVTPGAVEGAAKSVRLTEDTGYHWFFGPDNVEAVVKVLDACAFNDRFWVFAGGLTNVHTLITVTDTQHDAGKVYLNPQNRPFQPIQDTAAFTTCP